jgi:hypothetical protein
LDDIDVHLSAFHPQRLPLTSEPLPYLPNNRLPVFTRLAITSKGEFFFLTHQRLAARLMIGHMRGDRSYAFAIKLSDLLFPISAAVFGPLKRKLDDVPWLAEMGSGFQRGS